VDLRITEDESRVLQMDGYHFWAWSMQTGGLQVSSG